MRMELVAELVGQRVTGGSVTASGAEPCRPRPEFRGAEHPVRVVEEVGVDGHLTFGAAAGVDQIEWFGVDPVECVEADVGVGLAAAEDQ